MSAPKYDLAACVEAGSRAEWERLRTGKTFYMNMPAWDDLAPLWREAQREHVTAIVTAVLAVVEAGE